jgi:Membrane-bound toxin component of toxin-antitoxin system
LSRQYASPLLLKISYSKNYRNLVVTIFTLSALSIYLIYEQLGIISVFLFVFLIVTTLRALINNREFDLHWQDSGDWMIAQQHKLVPAKLCDSSVFTSICSVLNFKLDGGRRQSILIFKDNIDAESFRRLRVRVKVQGINPKAHDIIKP